jgi:hypothetical protein
MKRAVCSLALGLSFLLASCFAGPHQLRRSLDDYDQKLYIQNPWLDGILWFIPVFPIGGFVATIGDFFIGDLYSFWFKDAWDQKGTAFTHFNPTPTDGSMESLLIDNSKFLEIK